MNALSLKAKIKKIISYSQKIQAAFGALLMLFTAAFYVAPHYAQAQTCNVNVFFAVTDLAGKQINQLANKDTRFIMYAKYTGNGCSGAIYKNVFRNVFEDGTSAVIGSSKNLSFGNTANNVQEVKLDWQTSGLKDSKTKQFIQNNGSLKLEAALLTIGDAQVTKSSAITINVGNSTTTPDGQQLSSGMQTSTNSGVFDTAQDKSEGLVPCGRDSALTSAGYAGSKPADTCTVRDIFKLIAGVTNYLVILSGFFAVFQIVRSAFSMVLSQGNAEAIAGAKKHLVNSIIGLVLALMAFLLINTVLNGILGLEGGTSLLTAPYEYITR